MNLIGTWEMDYSVSAESPVDFEINPAFVEHYRL